MLPPWLALAFVFGSLIALLAGVVVGLSRARRRDVLAAAAEASVGARPPALVEGGDVVLSGIVRHYEDRDVAVKVRITQAGSEAESSGSWSHSWTEIDREIILAPFYLELANGELVLVEPPKNVDVADALDQKVWINRDRRVLSAELVSGESIFARGRLERSDRAASSAGYRDVKWGWALRPTRGQMLLSSEPLGAGLRQRAAFHRHAAWQALALLLVTQATVALFYLRLVGHTEEARVTGTNFYQTTDSDGDTNDHYEVSLRGETFEISQDDHANLHDGMTLPIRFASTDNWELGSGASIRWWHGGVLPLVASGFWLWYASRRKSSRPWFRRKVNESGSGRLPDAH